MPDTLSREDAIEKALLYVFQLSGKDYRKMQTALSENAFVRALEQDGYTVTPTAHIDALTAAARLEPLIAEIYMRGMDPPEAAAYMSAILRGEQ